MASNKGAEPSLFGVDVEENQAQVTTHFPIIFLGSNFDWLQALAELISKKRNIIFFILN